MLHFIYCGDLAKINTLDPPQATELLAIAHKYALPNLSRACEETLIKCIDLDDPTRLPVALLISLLDTAMLVNDGGLLYYNCMEFTLKYFPKLMATPEFADLAVSNRKLFRRVTQVAGGCLTVDQGRARWAKYKTPEPS
eukprot:NODE_5551_length_502_cov_37.843267_g4145_i0.p1 GENE.NODE_5551_length_502_cov_37.843267_g4145_i0~~NODE_5551_length_502_cov_37.843267_g4145_i0.p1  ORF type:complete len:139 (+),score=31.08 NODE_5551_length_502_cov_37.843267_g4145_i0:55-471(+)